jgi:hypothetical protein
MAYGTAYQSFVSKILIKTKTRTPIKEDVLVFPEPLGPAIT